MMSIERELAEFDEPLNSKAYYDGLAPDELASVELNLFMKYAAAEYLDAKRCGDAATILEAGTRLVRAGLGQAAREVAFDLEIPVSEETLFINARWPLFVRAELRRQGACTPDAPTTQHLRELRRHAHRSMSCPTDTYAIAVLASHDSSK